MIRNFVWAIFYIYYILLIELQLYSKSGSPNSNEIYVAKIPRGFQIIIDFICKFVHKFI